MLSRRAFIASVLLSAVVPLSGCQQDIVDDWDSDGDSALTEDEMRTALEGGKVNCNVTDLRVSDGGRDRTVLVIYYDFENALPVDVIDTSYELFKVYQDGVTLSDGAYTTDGLSSGKAHPIVKSGAKISDYLLFALNSTSPVKIKFDDAVIYDGVMPDSLPRTS